MKERDREEKNKKARNVEVDDRVKKEMSSFGWPGKERLLQIYIKWEINNIKINENCDHI